MLLAERLDVPVIDGDLMGRAYPCVLCRLRFLVVLKQYLRKRNMWQVARPFCDLPYFFSN